VEAIAKAHNKGPGQVLLRHLVQQQIIVIPKSVSAERVKQNFEISDFVLTPEEMKQLNDLDKGADGRSFNFCTFCKGYENNISNACIFTFYFRFEPLTLFSYYGLF
jgi:diketogulonate reductase-like aldo/keto reductase